MNKLSYALLSICLMTSASLSMAMDDMNQGSVGMQPKDNEAMMKQDKMDNGIMKQEAMKKKAHAKKKAPVKNEMDGKIKQGDIQPMK